MDPAAFNAHCQSQKANNRLGSLNCKLLQPPAFFRFLMANCHVFTAFAMSGHASDRPASEISAMAYETCLAELHLCCIAALQQVRRLQRLQQQCASRSSSRNSIAEQDSPTWKASGREGGAHAFVPGTNAACPACISPQQVNYSRVLWHVCSQHLNPTNRTVEPRGRS